MALSTRSTLRGVLGAALLAAGTVLVPLNTSAQAAWPNHPIKLIVPFAAGGSTDVVARALAIKLGARLGQPIIIENKGGAGGTIGVDFVARSTPDGYTLLCGSTTIATAAAAGNKLPYDAVKDLEPIGMIGTTPLVIVVSNDANIKTLRDLIDAARANPNSINYGSGGVGSMSHLGMELLSAEAKMQLKHIPYKGISLALNDVMGGNLQVTISAFASVAPLIKGGKLRALAVTSPQRSPFMPNLPTAAEAGLPGFQIEFWWGLIGPRRMPPAVVKRLNEELNAVLALPDVRDLLAREATIPKPGTPEELGKLISFDVARWSKLAKDANIKSN